MGTKDASVSDVAYIEALAAPDTIDTMPEATLAFADHGKASQTMPGDGGAAEAVLREFARAGIDVTPLPPTCSAMARPRSASHGTNC